MSCAAIHGGLSIAIIFIESFAEFQLQTKIISHDHEFTNITIKIIFGISDFAT